MNHDFDMLSKRCRWCGRSMASIVISGMVACPVGHIQLDWTAAVPLPTTPLPITANELHTLVAITEQAVAKQEAEDQAEDDAVQPDITVEKP